MRRPTSVVIAAELERHRLARGLTRAEMAELLGVSVSRYAQYVSPHIAIAAATAERIAQALDVDLIALAATRPARPQHARRPSSGTDR